MNKRRKSLRTFISSLLVISCLLATLAGASPARAADSPDTVSVKVCILTDERFATTNRHSEYIAGLGRLLARNKMLYDVIDVADLGPYTLSSSGNLRYSAMLILSPGWSMGADMSGRILEAAEKGLGVIGLMPDSINEELMPLFGIKRLGEKWLSAEKATVVKDIFTFAYQGQPIYASSQYLDHEPERDADIIARFSPGDAPAIWCYQYGPSKTIFYNSNSSIGEGAEGVLLQGILYVMPVGVASPVNAGVVEVDDFPRIFNSVDKASEWHYDYYQNFRDWLKTYNLKASFFLAFSYSGNIKDFWSSPESLECAADILRQGNELGLHCGSIHLPFDRDNWGSIAAISNELSTIMEEIGVLRERLRQEYNVELGDIVSFTPPANSIADEVYPALKERTTIKYVGTGYSTAPVKYPPTFRDFGPEKGLDIYNLPRIRGGFLDFNRPGTSEYLTGWRGLVNAMESGSPYIIFTHPDELDLPEYSSPETMKELFDSYDGWANYVSQHYSYYRWWTAAQLGSYMEKRAGFLEAEWLRQEDILKVRLSQPDDAVHVKTDRYVESAYLQSDTIFIKLRSSPVECYSNLDVVRVGRDYFFYPKGSASSLIRRPASSFVFTERVRPVQEKVSPPVTPAPTTIPPATPVVTEVKPEMRSLDTTPSFGGAAIVLLVGVLLLRIMSRKRRA